MNRLSTFIKAAACATFIIALATAANAQATRTWVSGVGDDVNPCSRTAPCKTYAGAISRTARGGEISTLDPGGFGAVTITKSITINGGGGGQGYGSIVASLINGVTINITDAADAAKTVRLNWLDINGVGNGLDGVRFLAGSALHVENTNIDGFAGDGIDVSVNAANTTPGEVYLKNVSVRNCGGSGVLLQHANAGGVVVASLTDVTVGNCGTGVSGGGVNVGARARATIRSGTFHSNTTAVSLTGVGNSEATLFNCSISNNSTGVAAGAAPNVARLAHNVIYGNSTGVSGNVKSWGVNFIDGNTVNGAPVAPNLPPL